jgi:ABC-type uncharacterized transport system substrate-binding protein
MRRREFIALVGGVVAWPAVARGQQPARVALIGYMSIGPEDEWRPSGGYFGVFVQELATYGRVEGKNIRIEYRAAESVERLPAVAAALVALKVDVILATSTPGARAARQATSTIPIVVPNMGDPIGDGLVASLAHPGGNITGTTFLGPELVPKRLELLKEAIPNASRFAVLSHAQSFSEPTMRDMLARKHGVQLQRFEVRTVTELDDAFLAIHAARADALILFPSLMLFPARERIVDLAAKHRLPTMYISREFVQLGGFIAYGINFPNTFRRAAAYVDQILKGAKPADLPVEQPTKFELVINLKTAKALGLTIPPSLLSRADEVIE